MRDENGGCFDYMLGFLSLIALILIIIYLFSTYGAPEWLESQLLKWGVIGE